jgi:hypothetical protein
MESARKKVIALKDAANASEFRAVAECDEFWALSAGFGMEKRKTPERSRANTERKRANLREKSVLI